MTIESIAGKRKYRISPSNPKMVQIQRGYGARWVDYAPRDTIKEAWALVLQLGKQGRDETQEMPAVKA